MPCFFKRPKASREVDMIHNIVYYQTVAKRAVLELPDGYSVLLDPRGRNVSITHDYTGHTVQARSDTAIDYYASIVASVDRIKEIVEMDAFKP